MINFPSQFQANGDHSNNGGIHGQVRGVRSGDRRNGKMFLQKQHNGEKYNLMVVQV